MMAGVDISPWLRLRRGLALPFYAIALLMDYLSDALGRIAAWIAGDDWP